MRRMLSAVVALLATTAAVVSLMTGLGGCVVGLLVGKGRPGTLLGFDRREEQRPWPLAQAVRWLHRHSVSVSVDEIESDWDDDVREVRCSRSGTATR